MAQNVNITKEDFDLFANVCLKLDLYHKNNLQIN